MRERERPRPRPALTVCAVCGVLLHDVFVYVQEYVVLQVVRNYSVVVPHASCLVYMYYVLCTYT